MVDISNFGQFEGNDVKLFTITNLNGLIAKFSNFGAILISLTFLLPLLYIFVYYHLYK